MEQLLLHLVLIKKIRIFDPRSNKMEQEQVTDNSGTRGFKALWMGDKAKIITTGFGKSSQRQVQLYDIKKLDKELCTQSIDNSDSTIIPYYDPAISVLYFAGRGDSTIKLMLITEDGQFIEHLNVHNNFQPVIGFTPLHKTELDVRKHQIMSFLKLEKKLLNQ